jgi:hypothetical protein
MDRINFPLLGNSWTYHKYILYIWVQEYNLVTKTKRKSFRKYGLICVYFKIWFKEAEKIFTVYPDVLKPDSTKPVWPQKMDDYMNSSVTANWWINFLFLEKTKRQLLIVEYALNIFKLHMRINFFFRKNIVSVVFTCLIWDTYRVFVSCRESWKYFITDFHVKGLFKSQSSRKILRKLPIF